MQITKPFLTGESLKVEIQREEEHRKALVDGLIYEGSTLMISSDPGVGKSTMTACLMAQASTGLPVFGFLDVPRPLKIYYLPSERGFREIVERFALIESEVVINHDNIIVDDALMGADVTVPLVANAFIERIESSGFKPDIIVLDPIYGFVSGGLSKDEKASEFCRFSTRLQSHFNCTILLLHHTTKDSFANDGSKIEKADPFYGSQWLKAHVTGSYHMKKSKTGGGVTLARKKNSHGNLHETIELDFNDETQVLTATNIESSVQAKSRALSFIRRMKSMNKQFTFDEFFQCLQPMSTSHCRRLISDIAKMGVITKHIHKPRKTLHQVNDVEF